MKKIGSRLGGVIVALTVALLGSAALAAPAQGATLGKVTSSFEACDWNLDTGVLTCYDSGAQLSAAILGAASKTTSKKSTNATSANKSTTATATRNVLATFYDGTSYNGSYVYSTADVSSCTGFSYSKPDMGSWNNRVDSVKVFDGCRVKFYGAVDYGSWMIGPYGTTSSLGSYNSSASSFKIVD